MQMLKNQSKMKIVRLLKILLVQAQLLEQDAIAKREEAYKYDPSLKPKETKSKVRVTASKDTAPRSAVVQEIGGVNVTKA